MIWYKIFYTFTRWVWVQPIMQLLYSLNDIYLCKKTSNFNHKTVNFFIFIYGNLYIFGNFKLAQDIQTILSIEYLLTKITSFLVKDNFPYGFS